MTRLNWLRKIYAGCLLFAAASTVLSAQTFTTLGYFTESEGAVPFSSLVQARDGNFYGTAGNGGANGYGTVFQVVPDGTISTVYSFCAETNCLDGANPGTALVLGTDGNLYGTTSQGGATCAASFGVGCGTVFKLTPTGVLTTLHSFDGSDGNAPGGLMEGSDRNLYGTTAAGGTGSLCVVGCGTVFRLSPGGTLAVLHNFNGVDGIAPSGLVQGMDGNLYGTTGSGGTSNACDGSGCGTVFKMTLVGTFASLHSFDFRDGWIPVSPLLQASSGAFYGVTFEGGNANSHGCSNGCGTIFKISSAGAFASVHKFHGSDGGNPDSALLQATDGNLYGVNPGAGEILKLTLPSTVTPEYTFSNSGGDSAILQSTNGRFYSTYGFGDVFSAVFSLDLGLNPFISFVLPTGKAGQRAQILGAGLIGATSVTFNGIPSASFSVVSDTYMTAVVPSGATTGPVVITTPTVVLTSNKNFTITTK